MTAAEHVATEHRHAVEVTVSTSILRLSAWQRLAAVAVLIFALWGAVLWAMT